MNTTKWVPVALLLAIVWFMRDAFTSSSTKQAIKAKMPVRDKAQRAIDESRKRVVEEVAAHGSNAVMAKAFTGFGNVYNTDDVPLHTEPELMEQLDYVAAVFEYALGRETDVLQYRTLVKGFGMLPLELSIKKNLHQRVADYVSAHNMQFEFVDFALTDLNGVPSTDHQALMRAVTNRVETPQLAFQSSAFWSAISHAVKVDLDGESTTKLFEAHDAALKSAQRKYGIAFAAA